jgi:hypothetical protein
MRVSQDRIKVLVFNYKQSIKLNIQPTTSEELAMDLWDLLQASSPSNEAESAKAQSSFGRFMASLMGEKTNA